jgi:hypoxanthine-DNA glycosylase
VAAISGFPPIGRRDARVLILGSMPGERSLAAAQYYAHPGNAFWTIVGGFFGIDPTAGYAARTRALGAHGLALWDVLRSCERDGSLDAAIVRASIEPNDFVTFFTAHRRITTVLCNGGAAHDLFVRRVAGAMLGDRVLRIERLPSTSPAHASLRLHEKQRRWHAALREALPGGACADAQAR